MRNQGKVRRATPLPGDPDRVWIGVRETELPYKTHNLFIPIVDESFLKDDDIEWDDKFVHFKKSKYKLLLQSPGVVTALVQKVSFRP